MTSFDFGDSMGGVTTEDLIGFQDRVRGAFNWTYEADLNSAQGLRTACNEHPKAAAIGWSAERREQTLEDLRSRLLAADMVVLVGADAHRNQLDRNWPQGTEMVAADGAVGACLGLVTPCCVVTDLDGGQHLDAAVEHGIPLVIHAHGDNKEAWEACLSKWESSPPPLVLTHQTHEQHEDMINPGGFTDGDRAVCFLHWLGVPVERMAFIGYSTRRVGMWSGLTDPNRKLEKLAWMAAVLDAVHPFWRTSAHDENR